MIRRYLLARSAEQFSRVKIGALHSGKGYRGIKEDKKKKKKGMKSKKGSSQVKNYSPVYIKQTAAKNTGPAHGVGGLCECNPLELERTN